MIHFTNSSLLETAALNIVSSAACFGPMPVSPISTLKPFSFQKSNCALGFERFFGFVLLRRANHWSELHVAVL